MSAYSTHAPYGGYQQSSNIGSSNKTALKVQAVQMFIKVWDDRDTGAQPHKVSFFSPVCPDDWYSIGDVASNSHDDAFSSIAIVVQDPSGTSNLLKKPTDFELVWSDRGTGGSFGNVFLWRPIAPSGYVALGDIATQSKEKPSLSTTNYRCVSISACTVGSAVYEEDGSALWTDRCSRARIGDVGVWSVRANLLLDPAGLSPGTFKSFKGYAKPPASRTFYVLVNPFYKHQSTSVPSSSGYTPPPPSKPTTPAEYYSRYPQQQQQYQQQQQQHYQQQQSQASAPYESAASMAQQQQQVPAERPDGYGLLRITYPQNFQQIVVKPVIEVVPFTVEWDAIKPMFEKWKQSRWFAPAHFAKECDQLNVKEAYVPYYTYNVHTTSAYDGQIGFYHRTKDCHGNSTIETRWRCASGIRTAPYSNILACASKNPELCKQMARIQSDFDLSKAQPSVSTDDSAFEVPYDWQYVWQNTGEKIVVNKERKAARSELKQNNRADRTNNVNVKIAINSLAYRFAYVPVYSCFYTWKDTTYRLYINGQTGDIYGQRPYGLGMLGSLFTRSPKDKNQHGLVTGQQLAAEEKKSGYNVNSQYLIFPPSDRKMLVARHWGAITLKNESSEPMELYSHMRKSTRRGLMYELKPNATESFRYEGHWCIEIVSGDPEQLKIESFERRSTDEFAPNLLGMAHN